MVPHDKNIPGNEAPVYVTQKFGDLSLNILRCNSKMMQKSRFDHVASPYWRLYWNSDSGALVSFESDVFALSSDRLTLICPNTSFSTYIEDPAIGPEGVSHLFAHFTTGHCHASVKPGVYQVDVGNSRHIRLNRICSELERDMHEVSSGITCMIFSILYQALGEIAESAWDQHISDPRIEKAVSFISENYRNQIYNKDLAQKIPMSSNGFARIFKEVMGVSPQKYILDFRLEQSCFRLHHSDDTLEQISEECGFCDRNYFTLNFTRKYGIGPASFRKSRQ